MKERVCRYAWALVPLGGAMWTPRYGLHFFTGGGASVPVTQRFAADFGLGTLGPPDWVCSCCQPPPDWLLKVELLTLEAGLLASLYVAWRISWTFFDSRDGARWQAVRLAAPWAALLVTLFAAGIWILLQPMQMRGTFAG